jgi:hypothetical protein
MPISTVHKLDKVLCTTPALDLSQIISARMSSETQMLIDRPAGHPHPLFSSIQSQRPVCEFSTSDLGTVLAAVGVGGAALATGIMYLKLGAATGSASRVGTSHIALSIAEGVIYWTRISLPHNGQGTVDVVLAANYDGVNNPVVATASVPLSGNLADSFHFGAGPVAVNGVAIPGVQSIEISSGVQLLTEGGESELWDTFTGIELTEPTIVVQTREAVNYGTFGLTGTILNGTTGITAFARKFAANNGRVANITAEHVKFVGALGAAIPQDTSGEGTSLTTDSILFQLVAPSDSTLPLVVTNNQAIT